MKNVKRILSVLMALAIAFCFAACNAAKAPQDTSTSETTATQSTYKGDVINIATTAGAQGMGMVKLFSNSNYNIKLTDEKDIVSLIKSGKVDVATCSIDVAAKLYADTNGGIVMLGLNNLCSSCVVTNDDKIISIKDLDGKTILLTEKDSAEAKIFDLLLETNGIKDKVIVDYSCDADKIVEKFTAGEQTIAVLSEPDISVAVNSNKNVKAAISLADVFKKDNDAYLSTGCVIASKNFVEKNKDGAKQFITDYKSSVEFVNVNPEEAFKALINDFIVPPEAKSSEKKAADVKAKTLATVGRANVIYVEGEQMSEMISAYAKASGNNDIAFDTAMFYGLK